MPDLGEGLLAPFQERLESIRTEWNKAELDIKQAEQICNDVVAPAINELRYSGRRLAEILYWVNLNDPESKIDGLLHDALFDCHRARHDAIDAGISKIAIDLDIAEEKIGYDPILKTYPDYPKLRKSVIEIKQKIKVSRGDRENREAIYSVIEKEDFIDICNEFSLFKASEAIMIELASEQRKTIFRNKLFGYGGLATAVIAIIVAVVAILVA